MNEQRRHASDRIIVIKIAINQNNGEGDYQISPRSISSWISD